MRTLRITQKDYLKANRRVSRQEEIDVHGKSVRISAVHKSRKKYDRKNEKAEFKKALPFLFLLARLHLQGFVSRVALSGICWLGRTFKDLLAGSLEIVLLGIWVLRHYYGRVARLLVGLVLWRN